MACENVPVANRSAVARLTRRGALRVPEITVYFWVIKALSTAMGEATSDYSVHAINPVIAVILGFCGFVAALSLQFWVRRYIAWTYWLAVVGVGVFGTMAADVLHVRFGVPYAVSTILYALALLAVFGSWQRTEGTLSFHTIDTPRREAFYWAAVVATFAMGTALGDLTATTVGLGYLASCLLFAVVIAIPAAGYRRWHWNAIFSFWFAYVATRPLGASFADWLSKPSSAGSLPDCAYLCPMAGCSKTSRNGPCGGSAGGRCELDDKECFWARVYDRLKYYGESEQMADAPVVICNPALEHTSSWANTFLDRDHHAEPPQGPLREVLEQPAIGQR